MEAAAARATIPIHPLVGGSFLPVELGARSGRLSSLATAVRAGVDRDDVLGKPPNRRAAAVLKFVLPKGPLDRATFQLPEDDDLKVGP